MIEKLLTAESSTEDVETTPAESQPEEVEPEETKAEEPEKEPEVKVEPQDEKPIPYHKDPRWKRMRQEAEEAKAEAKRALEEIEKIRTGNQPQAEESVPERFKNIFGEDVKAYKEWMDFQKEIAKQTVLEEMRTAQQAKEQEKQAQDQALQRIEKDLEEIGDEIGVDLVNKESTMRNQLLDICIEYELFDKNDMPNIRKALQLHGKLYPSDTGKVVEEKKSVVTKTTPTNTSPSKKAPVYTHESLKKLDINHFI